MKTRGIKANLMTDESWIKRIVGYASVSKDEKVLEIGAGTGNLTAELVKKAGHVYAIEKDRERFHELEERFSGFQNIELIKGDALKKDFPAIDKIVSNLPYEISRKITEKILGHGFSLAVLVYQKEYAEKLVAKPGTENYRYISALAQSCCEIEILGHIPPHAFSPQPKVDSAVVRLRQKKKAEKEHVSFLKTMFSKKNKLLKKAIPKAPPELREKRVSQLTPEELEALFIYFY